MLSCHVFSASYVNNVIIFKFHAPYKYALSDLRNKIKWNKFTIIIFPIQAWGEINYKFSKKKYEVDVIETTLVR